jgi:hypothetical protein
MSIPDKVGAANKINELLGGIVTRAGLRLKYRITVDPPLADNRDWESRRFWLSFPGRIPRCSSNAGQSCSARSNC